MLREDGKKSCEDYVEFGEEDVIPFITMKRSGRMCGKQAGESLYDDPGGQLLIWLGLGEVVPSDLPKLTLVITPYSKKPDHRNNQLKKCKRSVSTNFVSLQQRNVSNESKKLFCQHVWNTMNTWILGLFWNYINIYISFSPIWPQVISNHPRHLDNNKYVNTWLIMWYVIDSDL